ncbi:hypothetical protein SLS60_002136 [Paraconiothyrium brasiliense]|uniref:MFS general substrate transporter n=1 Tax=Paraconiothyrium brasiliense TaxID=300254 RepID=A0ABR3S1X9_9PLEO
MNSDEKGPAAGAGAEDATPTLPYTSSSERSSPTIASTKERSNWRKIYDILTYTPPRCRWDPERPPQFSMSMNVLFAFAAGFTVANLYYSHPILNILARDFGVKYEKVAQIPTVMQAGYAAGLLFLYYPATNTSLNYFRLLWSIVQMLTRHPVLVQACLAGFFTSSTFTSFWTTLTFLLAGAPYFYSPLVIGLFGLIGIAAMCFGPIWARNVTDKFVPHMTVLFGLFCCMLGICFGTYLGTFTVAGPVLQAFLLDFGMQTAQIANRSAIYAVEPKRRNGVNTAFMVATFCGQLMGTAAGNHIYAAAGWIGSGSASVGFVGGAILVMMARGPWETRWFGWRGGWSFKKKDKMSADGKTGEVSSVVQGEEGKDEEMGAEDKVLEEIGAEKDIESRLRDERVRGRSYDE